jgi:hypothetical protein
MIGNNMILDPFGRQHTSFASGFSRNSPHLKQAAAVLYENPES